MAHKTFLLLGSNLGNRAKILLEAQKEISSSVGIIVNKSSIYETLAWGIEDQPAFLNQVLLVETTLTPQELLKTVNKIEELLGRVRHQKWGERLIDIDILYFENQIINEEHLKIPHPEILNRRFTLVPLVEIAADFIHSGLGKTQKELLDLCGDELAVKKYILRLGGLLTDN
ncbi:2-amino-4-hydroxy-6-hydroxymethyldihydropteridinepyrophosphokinase [hydrothermal vent metagenome]|uniref:2-amino-4-hydroxy-6-hydroxymethyldihydropteridine diphosphokinase n=1 Tax=hydrothermal vent metagenome TaxID=652676 RepID=A0A3B0UBS6_9ZZZZ